MERIGDMEESSYELSSKDIVDKSVGVDEENKSEGESKKNNKSSKISHMEIRQSLMIEMCVPSFSISFRDVFPRIFHRFRNDHLHKEKFVATTTSNW
ncbi:hypothetical protein M5689_005292 [Euphorbia peplus]|nr:hypothetical protein M5689_005292 [Euphorbia peplus]